MKTRTRFRPKRRSGPGTAADPGKTSGILQKGNKVTQQAWAIIVAAGGGSRMGASTNGTPKQFLEWRGRPLYWHSARAFCRCGAVHGLVFVFPAEGFELAVEQCRAIAAEEDPGLPWIAAPGGERRQDSVRHGLDALPHDCTHVLVHDAARPFLSAALAHRVLAGLERAPAVVPGLRMTDTIKRLDGERVAATLPRDQIAAVQTPQGFDARLLRAAHAAALEQGLDATDDAALMEAQGHAVIMVEGDADNRKITRAEDLRLLTDAPAPSAAPRVGFGYDVHRYGPGRPLRLGGVPLEGGMEVVAHSDGDVLLHALMDALLGCAGLGDIGEHFPDADAAFDNISSAVLLDEVLRLFHGRGLRLSNVDLTIVAQKPRVGAHKAAIRKNVARLLRLPPECVNVKATTEEKLGFTGRVEGIKAQAVVCAVADA